MGIVWLTFVVLCALAFAYEYWRISIDNERIQVEESLMRARIEIDLLTDFAKVCAWCKSVKAADGNWISMETYLGSSEDVDVSHSICIPDGFFVL